MYLNMPLGTHKNNNNDISWGILEIIYNNIYK